MSAGATAAGDEAPPHAWQGQAQWRVLQVGWDGGAAFLRLWQRWRADPHRPRLLHGVAIAGSPEEAAQLLQPQDGEAGALAGALAAQWDGLAPGFHRFSLEDGKVLLTLCVGEVSSTLRELAFRADAVVVAGPQAFAADAAMAKAVTRLCRRDAMLTAPQGWKPHLAVCGWQAEGEGPDLSARYAPDWDVKGLQPETVVHPSRATVIGAGLAGAAVAASLARRGWSVLVVDAAAAPAMGASQLPVGLLAPHQTPDDNPLSRLSRAGVRITLQEATRRLAAGLEWGATGVLEWRGDDPRPPPPIEGLEPWTRGATETQKRLAGWAPSQPAWWHGNAAWIEPAALVRSWLRDPGIRFEGSWQVHQVRREGPHWHVDAADGRAAVSSLVVVAAALGSAALVPAGLQLQAVRGQVTWAPRPENAAALPPFPVNGNGHFLPDVPLVERGAWITGSTYGRGETEADVRGADDTANLDRARTLLPGAGALLAGSRTTAWSGVRCASSDRRPLVGELAPGMWVSTAMGSRGLTFAALCGELLAARLHGEPLPLPLRLAQALDAARQGR